MTQAPIRYRSSARRQTPGALRLSTSRAVRHREDTVRVETRRTTPFVIRGALLATALLSTFGSTPRAFAQARGDSAVALSPCEVKGVTGSARCGTITVPEDARRPDGRQIALYVVVLPATGGRALPDPIVDMGGGP